MLTVFETGESGLPTAMAFAEFSMRRVGGDRGGHSVRNHHHDWLVILWRRCVVYPFGTSGILPFRILWCWLYRWAQGNLGIVWLIADTLNAFMAIPNLVALLLLPQWYSACPGLFFRRATIPVPGRWGLIWQNSWTNWSSRYLPGAVRP